MSVSWCKASVPFELSLVSTKPSQSRIISLALHMLHYYVFHLNFNERRHFAAYFIKKIDYIKSYSWTTLLVITAASLSLFQQSFELQIRRIIMSSAGKSSSRDPVPAFCKFLDLLLPYLNTLVNASLALGWLP